MPLIRYEMDGEKREQEFRSLRLQEAIEVQVVTKFRPNEFGLALEQGDATAIAALVMLLEKRAGRLVRFSDVDFDLASFDTSYLPEEEAAAAEASPPADAADAAADESSPTKAGPPAKAASPRK